MTTTPQRSPNADAFLVVRQQGGWCDIYRVNFGRVTTLGRDPENNVVVHDEKCSRRHCEIVHGPDGALLRDLHSRNGTKLNGMRVAGEVRLNEGDLIRIGNVEFLFTPDVSGPLDAMEVVTDSLDSLDGRAVEILQRASQTRLLTESSVFDAAAEPVMRAAFAQLYHLAAEMIAASDVASLSAGVLKRLLTAVQADIGAILLFPPVSADLADPFELRVIAYQSPPDTPYHRVSTRLSSVALREKQAILGMDIGGQGSVSQTLVDLQAKSVICAPVRCGDRILGLLHLYSQDAARQLGADSLDFALAVADQLALAIQQLYERESLTGELAAVSQQNRSLRKLLEIESDLVGDSRQMRLLRDTIARVAASDATALVRGESGVGKELVARAIHFNSTRRDGPFVCVNCAALTESLLESELFGHEKGSFTGAADRKVGKFELADGGTLFLDEIGDMPLGFQAKFLRVLEGHAFERVGGNTAVRVNVRVVAATNCDLEQAVTENRFRKDLFYRLQVLELIVPALREHPHDIPALAAHFLARCCQRLGRPPLTLAPAAVQVLERQEWLGNVRELRNVIERTVVMADGPEILPSDLRLVSTQDGSAAAADAPEPFSPAPLDTVERRHILRTLRWTNGNKREAARLLGINRSTLDRKLERYGEGSSGGDEPNPPAAE